MRTTKTLIRLRGCAGWFGSSLSAHVRRNDSSRCGSYVIIYEGESISNQPIPFPMDRDGHDFHALFQYMYMFYTWVAMDAVERNGYELIPHPAYSPDLAPSDFFLFLNLKKDIRGLHFRSDEEVVTAVEEWVIGKDPDFFSSGLMALEHRWSKCIALEGNYIEKEEVDLNRK